MSAVELQAKVPQFTLPVIAGLMIITLLYSILVTGNIVLWLAAWGGLFSLGVSVLLVYLFYRLVVAVERIAERQ